MLRIVLLTILLGPISLSAQPPAYPQNFFRNPLNIPILLAGNFGECRPGHFHSGLDIKTEGRENLPVYAAADGYVSRIKLEPGGFGHCIYITHSNGYTTLYAHLNDFAPAIGKYVHRKQYENESWTLDLSFTPDQFPVRKGDLIAFSGNTGGSTAPHLHFEIRDNRTEHPLNPQLFGFDIKDKKAPVISQLAIYDRAAASLPPQLLPLRKIGNTYYPEKDTIPVLSPDPGLGIVSDDFMEGSDNTLAFYTAEWYLDDSLQGKIVLDDIGYEETRYLHAFADYGVRQRQGPWVQRLYRLKGNRLGHIYESLNSRQGLIPLGDPGNHRVRIDLKDAYGNSSELRFTVSRHPGNEEGGCSGRLARANQINKLEIPGAYFYLDEQSLYDDACLTLGTYPDSNAVSPRFTIGSPDIPVHHSFDLYLKPDKLVPFALRSKVALIYSDGKDQSGRAATLSEKGQYKASVRALGDYRLVIDTTAPIAKAINPNRAEWTKIRSIAFRVTDNLTGIKSFRGELDGKWLLFEQQDKTWTYVFDEHCPKGKHELVIRVKDENDNQRTMHYTFTR